MFARVVMRKLFVWCITIKKSIAILVLKKFIMAIKRFPLHPFQKVRLEIRLFKYFAHISSTKTIISALYH